MKIVTYKVPAKLKRSDSGEVEVELDENSKEQVKAEQLSDDSSNIISLSKQISDHNEKQKTMLAACLSAKETEKETFVQFRYLEQ